MGIGCAFLSADRGRSVTMANVAEIRWRTHARDIIAAQWVYCGDSGFAAPAHGGVEGLSPLAKFLEKGKVMSVNTKSRVAPVAAVVVGFGWLSLAVPAVAQCQPAHVQPPAVISCPDGGAFGGVQYVQDPDNSNAYYVCAGGLPQQHPACPANTSLNMNTNPPSCAPWRANY